MQDESKVQSAALFGHRPRLLLTAYCLSPNGSMEERNGWQRAIQATRQMDVTLIYVPNVPILELKRCIPDWVRPNALTFVPVDNGWLFKKMEKHEFAFYAVYRLWHWRAFQVARALHEKMPFHGSHLVTLCGFREPGFMWKIGIPHIWGPLGGTHNLPTGFSRSIKLSSRWREWLRSKLNTFQLTHSRRIRRAMHRSAAVISATTGAQSDFKMGFGIESDVELETGIDHKISSLRQARDLQRPLRILWAGRLREWKGLPILLYAIASLPKNVSVQLRVVGDGSSKKGWMKLAAKLGIAGRIEWISWPRYEQTLPYYSWADVFAFTSLRDTSGTGLLESLAAGCPIVGLNHQGAKDIMTSECAIQVSATNLESSVSGFREGIVRMATDSEAWLRLSHGASTRAKSFVWGDRPGCVEGKYEQFISCAGEVEKRPQTSSPETSVPRVLIIAVACSPVRGSEGGVGWNRAIQSARFFDTCVVTRECDLSREILDYIKANGEIERLRFVVVPDSKMGLFLENFGISFYLSYYLWQRRAFKVAKELNIQQPFDLVHQTTYCGYREPGLCWKLPIPFVWGPFGGTQDLPWRFLTSLGFSGGLREAFRTTVNQFQLRFGRAARNAFRNSAAVIAANASVQKDCLKYFGVSPEVRLETGINRIATQPKPMLDTSRPLRILWSGGLQPRKSLHLLLHALEQIPSELKVEVRILGHGSEMSRWMKLAKKLRVDDHTQFLGWLPHHEALQLLSWADVFVFTSLRETSGNVVLEALAEGLPVIVLDHQGVRDIVTEDCGIKIPVTSPNVVAAALAKAIAGLAKAPERYQALSAGALVRAKTYAWDSHGEHMAAVYRRVMKHK